MELKHLLLVTSGLAGLFFLSCLHDSSLFTPEQTELSPSILWRQGEAYVSPSTVDSVKFTILNQTNNRQIKTVTFPFSLKHASLGSIPSGISIKLLVEGLTYDNRTLYKGEYTQDGVTGKSITIVITASGVTPLAPDSTSATASDSTIMLIWADKSNNESGYIIYRRTDKDTSFITIDTVNGTAFTDTNVSLLTKYDYLIRSFNEIGLSLTSDTVLGLSVLNSNVPPKIVTFPTAVAMAESLYQFTPSVNDPDDTLFFWMIKNAPLGMMIDSSTGTISWRPEKNINSTDSISLYVFDRKIIPGADSLKFKILVLNRAAENPIVSGKSVTVNEDTSIIITLSATYPKSDSLSWSISSAPVYGTLTGSQNQYVFIPNKDFNGKDVFYFSAFHGTAHSNTGVVEINVMPVNDPPVAVNKVCQTQSDTILAVTMEGRDPEQDSLQFEIITYPKRGTILESGATVSYRPEAGFNGYDTLIYIAKDSLVSSLPGSIIFKIGLGNHAPVVQNLDITITEDSTAAFTLKGNDIDGDQLFWDIVRKPLNGTLSGTSPFLNYTPYQNSYGKDSLFFRATDSNLQSGIGVVRITVIPINDAPVAVPWVHEDTMNGVVDVTMLALDAENNPYTFAITGQPKNGTITGTVPDITYTPLLDFTGLDTLFFTASDSIAQGAPSSIVFSIGNVNHAPVSHNFIDTTFEDTSISFTLISDDIDKKATLGWQFLTQPLHGKISGLAPDMKYTPDPDFSGREQFYYVTNDGAINSNIASVVIHVLPVNDAPVALADYYEVNEDEVLSVPVKNGLLQNDLDQENDPKKAAIYSNVTKGSVSLGEDGSFSFIPPPNYSGIVEFSYSVTDDKSASSGAAVVRIVVLETQDKPLLSLPENRSINENDTLQFSVSAIDSDGTVPNISIISILPSGAHFNGNTFTWVPSYSQSGIYTVIFRAEDSSGLADQKTMTLTVKDVDRLFELVQKPTNDAVEIDGLYSAQVHAADPDNDSVTFSLISAPIGMTISDNQIRWIASRTHFRSDTIISATLRASSKDTFIDYTWNITTTPHTWEPVTEVPNDYFNENSTYITAANGSALYRINMVASSSVEKLTIGSSIWESLPIRSSGNVKKLLTSSKNLFLLYDNGLITGFDIATMARTDSFTVMPQSVYSYEDASNSGEIYGCNYKASTAGCKSVLFNRSGEQWSTSSNCISWHALKVLPDSSGYFAISRSISDSRFHFSKLFPSLGISYVIIGSDFSRISTDNNDGDTVFIFSPAQKKVQRTTSGLSSPQFSSLQNADYYTPKSLIMLDGALGWILDANGKIYFTNNSFESLPFAEQTADGGKVEQIILTADKNAAFAIGTANNGVRKIYKY